MAEGRRTASQALDLTSAQSDATHHSVRGPSATANSCVTESREQTAGRGALKIAEHFRRSGIPLKWFRFVSGIEIPIQSGTF